jgi:hypothetical protein
VSCKRRWSLSDEPEGLKKAALCAFSTYHGHITISSQRARRTWLVSREELHIMSRTIV